MAERSFRVKKGWLIAPDEFGNMLPFFLHTRDKDIVWQSENSEVVNDLIKTGNITNISQINPSQRLSFLSEGWRVEVDTKNKICYLYTSIGFSKDQFNVNENRDDLYGNITLPIGFIDNAEFNILCTLNTNMEQLSFSTINANKVVSNNTHLIDNIVIHVRNAIYKFAKTFYNIESYQDSTIYITITGRYKEKEIV